MNFFGHVVVTTWRSSDPGLALGSMLPDFAGMCGGRLQGARDPAVAAGIDFHHKTDKAFHVLKSFSALESRTSSHLSARGVGRGGAMGVGHVGVELLLDGVLLDDARACELYLAALERAEALAADRVIEWADPEHGARWDRLRSRLRHHGLPEGYRDPESVAGWVARVLSRHPSLALSEPEQEIVRAELGLVQDWVTRETPALMAELRRALGL